jgi:hypothetical protein
LVAVSGALAGSAVLPVQAAAPAPSATKIPETRKISNGYRSIVFSSGVSTATPMAFVFLERRSNRASVRRTPRICGCRPRLTRRPQVQPLNIVLR